jgi:hypothetical protein
MCVAALVRQQHRAYARLFTVAVSYLSQKGWKTAIGDLDTAYYHGKSKGKWRRGPSLIRVTYG